MRNTKCNKIFEMFQHSNIKNIQFYKCLQKQGAWTRWEDIINRVITWADIWRTPQSQLSFLVRAAYDTLPCPRNLSQWFGSKDKCPLCNKANAGLQHILSGCNVALTQGRFRWRHNQVLWKLAEQLERCRVRANSSSVTLHPNVPFLRPGEGGQKTVAGRTTCLLTPGKGWEMRVDLGTQLIFPTEITQTTLRPDAVVCPTAAKKAFIIELTVPWEEGIQAAHEFKRLKYSDLVAKCKDGGWTATIHPVEVGCRGFVGKSAIQLLRAARTTGISLRRAIKELSKEAEKAMLQHSTEVFIKPAPNLLHTRLWPLDLGAPFWMLALTPWLCDLWGDSAHLALTACLLFSFICWGCPLSTVVSCCAMVCYQALSPFRLTCRSGAIVQVGRLPTLHSPLMYPQASEWRHLLPPACALPEGLLIAIIRSVRYRVIGQSRPIFHPASRRAFGLSYFVL